MCELPTYGVKGKVYRLVYKLNEESVIRVKVTEVGEKVGQGTNEGAIISTVYLDGGVQEEFADSDKDVKYSSLNFGACFFQDDVARLAVYLESVKN